MLYSCSFSITFTVPGCSILLFDSKQEEDRNDLMEEEFAALGVCCVNYTVDKLLTGKGKKNMIQIQNMMKSCFAFVQ